MIASTIFALRLRNSFARTNIADSAWSSPGHGRRIISRGTWPMSGEVIDNTPLELADLINRVLDKGAVIAGSVTISVGDIDLIQLDLTVVLTAIETVRSAERRRRDSRGE